MLQLNEDGSFKILQVTDMHYEGRQEVDIQNDGFLGYMVDVEKPDFIAFTGDIVSGDMYQRASEGNGMPWYTHIHKRFSQLLTRREVPYAINLGKLS